MRFVGKLALDTSSISGYGGKASGPGVSDIAACYWEVDD